MKPVELILATLPTLKDSERAAVVAALNMPPPPPARPVAPCARLGHKFKVVEDIPPKWLGLVPGRVISYCERCGEQLTHIKGF